MTKVNFYDSIDDSMLKFAVIIAKHNGKWVFCKHRERSTAYSARTAHPFQRNGAPFRFKLSKAQQVD